MATGIKTLHTDILKRARQGDASAQCIMGTVYYNAVDIENNCELSFYWLKLSAEQGYAESQWKLANLYLLDHGNDNNNNINNKKTASELYIKAALQNDPYALEIINLWGKCNKSEENGILKQFESDSSITCLAFCYQHGLLGAKKDRQQAILIYIKAHEEGSIDAQYQLGLLYEQDKKYQMAHLWYQKAANGGNKGATTGATSRLAFLYEHGLGTEVNINKAIELYLKVSIETSSNTSHFNDIAIDAQINLARNYRKMNDVSNAIKWYTEALSKEKENKEKGINKRQYRAAKSCLDQLLHQQPTSITLTSRLRLDISQISDPATQIQLKKLATRALKKDGTAMYEIATFYNQERYFPLNKQIALSWMKNAAINGRNKEAQFFVGKDLQQRKGDTSFIKWYTLAANQGHTVAQYSLGMFYISDTSVDKNITEAYKWFSMAQQDDPDAQYQLGLLSLNYGDSHFGFSHNKNNLFIKWFEKSAKQGHIPAIYSLGLCYFDGHGVPRDRDRAITYYEYCASKNFANALFTLGNLYHKGHYLGKNKNKAFDYFTAAAEYDHTEAKYWLAIMYLEETVFDLDYEKAYSLFKDAADNGHAKAASIFKVPFIYSLDFVQDYYQIVPMLSHVAKERIAKVEYNLGYIYEHGYQDEDNKIHFTSNITLAVKWYSIAANKNDDVRAQTRLGVLYEKGCENFERNLAASISHYIKAVDQGNPEAMYGLACIYLGRHSPPVQLLVKNKRADNGFSFNTGLDSNEKKSGFTFGTGSQTLSSSFTHKTVSTSLFGQVAVPAVGFGGGSSSNSPGEQSIFHFQSTAIEPTVPNDTISNLQNSVASDISIHKSISEIQIQDLKKAFYLFREASDMGHLEAKKCLELSSNRLLAADEIYMNMFETIANDGNVTIQYQLGCFYAELEPSKAIQWFEMAIQNNISDAYYRLGVLYEKEGNMKEQHKQSVEKIIQLFQKAADDNHTEALYKLAEIYFHGTYIAKDYIKAFEFYNRASQQGHEASLEIVDGRLNCKKYIVMYKHVAEKFNNEKLQYILGSIYENLDKESDYSESIKWYKMAANKNHKRSLHRLGEIYKNGIGVERDYKVAVNYYIEAHKQDSSYATYCLGEMYQHGYGVDVDEKTSLEYYKTAANQKNCYAQVKLGELYEKGGSVIQQDIIQAAKWYAQGHLQELDNATFHLYSLFDTLNYEADFGNKLSKLLSKIENHRITENEAAYDSVISRLHYRLALLYYNESDIKRDLIKAMSYFIISSEKYHYPQATHLLNLTYTGNSDQDKINYLKKLKMYEAAINHIDHQKIYNLAMVYFNGIFVETSLPNKESCSTTEEEDDEDEENQITHLVEKTYIIPQNYYKALKFFSKAADHDNYEALTCMGDIYWDGLGITKDPKEAVKHHQNSANLRTSQSNYDIGLEYYQSKTAYPVAMVYLNKACDQKNYLATRYVGDMFRQGLGVDKNFSKAMVFYKKPSDQNPEFNFEVGMDYFEGRNGIKIEYLIAMVYFEKAAKKDHQEAIKNLARLYSLGCNIGIDESVMKEYMKKIDSNIGTLKISFPTPNREHQTIQKDDIHDIIDRHATVANQQDGLKNLDTGRKYYGEHHFSIALEYFKKAIDQGKCFAHIYLADMYYHGQGLEKNDRLAREHYIKAADQLNGYTNYLRGLQYYCDSGAKKNYFAAFIFFKKASEQGNSLALKYMGEVYRYGHGVDTNLEMAFTYYQAVAEQQNGDNNYSVGLEYYEGKGVEKDYSIALLYFKKAVEQRNADGCTYLARMYFYGHGVKEDHATSASYIEKAKKYDDRKNQEGKQRESIKDWFNFKANESKPMEWHEEFSLHPAPQDNLSIGLKYYKDRHSKKSATLATFYIQKASEKGDISAQKYIAQMYRDGKMTEKNDKQAEALYRNIAKQQDASMNFTTAVQYYEGNDVVMNYSTAFIFFHEAVEKNHLQSLGYVADMYCSGKGVEKDFEKAIEYHRKCSEHQTMTENNSIGVKYHNMHALEHNHSIAFIYLKNAVEQGCRESEVLLGDMYYRGLGVDQNYGVAYFYFQKAFNHGNPEGEQRMITYDFHDQDLNRDQVLEWNLKFASLQNKEENINLGLKFFEGKQIQQDYEVAFIYFKKAAEEEHYDSLRYLGDMYYHGCGTEKNQAAARNYYTRAADLQYGYYNYALGLDYYDGKHANRNYFAAFIFMKKAAEQGNILAFKYLGDFYNYGYGTDKDEVKALECHRNNAYNLDSANNCKLGMEYYYGKGVDQCYVTSIVYFQRSVDQGNDEGQMYLIDMCMNGFGTDKDFSVASNFVKKVINESIRKNKQLKEFVSYTQADMNGSSTYLVDFHRNLALQYNSFDNFSTGLKYYYGDLIEQNYSFAFIYLSKALEQGQHRAQQFLDNLNQKGYGTKEEITKLTETRNEHEGRDNYNYGMSRYNGGFHGPPNYFVAFEYLNKAAQQGFVRANLTLGDMYSRGLGIQKDIKKASKCYDLASTIGLDVPIFIVAVGFHCSQTFSSCFSWYQRVDTADENYENALRGIGLLYEYGDGVSCNYQAAFENYRLSSQEGNKGGHLNLGLLYYFGKGVEKNYDTAYDYFNKVITGGYNDDFTFVVIKPLEAENTAASRSSNKTYQLEKESYIYGVAYYYLGKINKYKRSKHSNSNKAEEYFKIATELGVLEAVGERNSVFSFQTP